MRVRVSCIHAILVFACSAVVLLVGCSGAQQSSDTDSSSSASMQSTVQSSSKVEPEPASSAMPVEQPSAQVVPAQVDTVDEAEVECVTSMLAAAPAEYVVAPEHVEAVGLDALFTVQPVPDDVFARMDGVTFPADCPVDRAQLRYLRLVHKDAQGQIKIGEMIANQNIAEDLRQIFRSLYEQDYPIERVRLASDYGGDDEQSMRANNTSCFNCRPIEGSGAQSWHSYGMAVDINPLYNPYVQPSTGEVLPATATAYVDRSVVGPYTLVPQDLCCSLFEQRGFTWGGWWTSPKDYQHFELSAY